MNLIVNIILAVVAFFATDYVLVRMKVSDPLKVALAALVAILVFLANFAARLV